MLEKAKITWSGKVTPLEIGATQENGGTRSHSLTIGGAETLPFLDFEGHTGFPPALAMEVWDMKPPEWRDVLSDAFGSVLEQPVDWAQFAMQRGAEAICLRFASSHPDFKNTNVAESVRLVKSLLANVPAPLIILGSGHIEKDRELLPALCEATAGERVGCGLPRHRLRRSRRRLRALRADRKPPPLATGDPLHQRVPARTPTRGVSFSSQWRPSCRHPEPI